MNINKKEKEKDFISNSFNSISNDMSKSFSVINYDDLKCLSLDSMEKENIENSKLNIQQLNDKLKKHKEKLKNIKMSENKYKNHNMRMNTCSTNIKNKREMKENSYLLREIKIGKNKSIPIVYSLNNCYIGNKYYTLISLPSQCENKVNILLNDEKKEKNEKYKKVSKLKILPKPIYNSELISNLHVDYFPNPPC